MYYVNFLDCLSVYLSHLFNDPGKGHRTDVLQIKEMIILIFDQYCLVFRQ